MKNEDVVWCADTRGTNGSVTFFIRSLFIHIKIYTVILYTHTFYMVKMYTLTFYTVTKCIQLQNLYSHFYIFFIKK